MSKEWKVGDINPKNYIIQGHKHTFRVLEYLVNKCNGILKNQDWNDCTDPQWYYFVNDDGNIDRVSDIDNNDCYEKSSYEKIKNKYTVLASNCIPSDVVECAPCLYERPIEQFQKIVKDKFDIDNWDGNFYDLLDACPMDMKGDVINTFQSEDLTIATEISDWLKEYEENHKRQRLSIYPIVLRNKKGNRGSIFLCNGLNGSSIVSVHSLPHVIDIIKHIEDTYDARAYISYCGNHSDVYYYGINFVVWGREREESPYVPMPDENGNWQCNH